MIESILNSRALVAISQDVEDNNALTPGYFLMLEPLTAIPFLDFTDSY